jgi:hypothetical protein
MASTSHTFKDSTGASFPVEFRTTLSGNEREVVVIGDGEAAGFVDLGAHLGADGDTPPAIAANATGMRGWLRAIFDRLVAGLTVSGAVTVSNEIEVKNDAGAPLATRASDGVFGYATGTAAGNVDVPTGARIKRVSVVAGSGGAATVSILGGGAITVPASGGFDEQVAGDALGTSGATDVVVGGTVASYYVAWTV